MRIICLLFYYGFAQYLPDSYLPIVGKISNAIRIGLVKHIFKKCGKITTINRLAYFGSGCVFKGIQKKTRKLLLKTIVG